MTEGFKLLEITNWKDIINRGSIINTINIPTEIDNFNLLKSIKKNDSPIDLDKILDYEKSHSKLFPDKQLEEKNVVFLSKNNIFKGELNNNKKSFFINDSFFNRILLDKEKKLSFEKINEDKNFKVKLKEELSNTSAYFFYPILKELKEEGKMKEIEEKLNTQIKSLNTLQKENITLISNIYQVPEEIKDIKYYRKVKANGDSFYISFIYQYIRNKINIGDSSIIIRIINLEREYQILNSPLDKSIKAEDLGAKYEQNTISNNFQELKNLSQAFGYLGIIFSMLTAEKDQNKNAVKMFNLAFSYDKVFWKLLYLFMKTYIKEFLDKNSDKFDINEYCNKNNLISNYYYKNEKFNYELYIKDNLLIDEMEPSLFIISIVPYMFDVTLNLYINEEGTYNEEEINQLIKIEINSNKDMVINILYSSYSYHIIENNINFTDIDINMKMQYDICNIFNYTLKEEIKNYDNKNQYIIKTKDVQCEKCKKNEYIIIKNISNDLPICLNCFKDIVDNVLINRYKNMLLEKFKYIEFYLKEIPLIYIENSNDYIYLSLTEFFYIFNQNIFTYFRNLIRNICDRCGKYYKNKKIINKICGCKRCIECAKKECGNILFFNNFEKNYIYKNDIIKCNCGKEIEKLNYASQIYNIVNGDTKIMAIKEAKERTKKYIKEYCMICGKKNDKNKIRMKPQIFHSREMTDKKKENIQHQTCEECNNKNNKFKDISCIICGETHNFNFIINSNISKSTNIKIIKDVNLIIGNYKNQKQNNENISDKKDESGDNNNIDNLVNAVKDEINSKNRKDKEKVENNEINNVENHINKNENDESQNISEKKEEKEKEKKEEEEIINDENKVKQENINKEKNRGNKHPESENKIFVNNNINDEEKVNVSHMDDNINNEDSSHIGKQVREKNVYCEKCVIY